MSNLTKDKTLLEPKSRGPEARYSRGKGLPSHVPPAWPTYNSPKQQVRLGT